MMTLGGDRKTWKAKHYALMPNGFLVFHSKRGDKKPKGVRILAHCTVGPWEGWGLEHVFRIDGIEPAAVQVCFTVCVREREEREKGGRQSIKALGLGLAG